jgi:hypothetical protein
MVKTMLVGVMWLSTMFGTATAFATSVEDCAKIRDKQVRLECFDTVARASPAPRTVSTLEELRTEAQALLDALNTGQISFNDFRAGTKKLIVTCERLKREESATIADRSACDLLAITLPIAESSWQDPIRRKVQYSDSPQMQSISQELIVASIDVAKSGIEGFLVGTSRSAPSNGAAQKGAEGR